MRRSYRKVVALRSNFFNGHGLDTSTHHKGRQTEHNQLIEVTTYYAISLLFCHATHIHICANSYGDATYGLWL